MNTFSVEWFIGGGLTILILVFLYKFFWDWFTKLRDKNEVDIEDSIKVLNDFKANIEKQITRVEIIVDRIKSDHTNCSSDVHRELKKLYEIINQFAVVKAREIAEFEVKIDELYRRVEKLEDND